ncbi:hypothetical protein ASG52_25255 [Methylobacterium sp. Leaf456]|uniref:hypothetical protein n=1 Tax=Methylobacterium sp. Leaf456 TaxID=1736382 RepID=UPI0006F7A0D5|nr:hypothetical protein [Methylobacterium sp. Leaf456]KQT55035.1 hypothetical protein ASG52_25255 [Methylobacterium sp. Leaf456]
MDRSNQTAAANEAVHEALASLIREGHDRQDLSNVLISYALTMMVETHGRQEVARYLYLLSLKFADDAQPIPGTVRVKH